MSLCHQCGTALPETGQFCPECGAARATSADTGPIAAAAPAPAAPAAPTRTLPPAPAATAAAAPAVPHIDLSRLLVGNWVGAAVVAAAALLTSGLLSVVVVLLGKPVDFGLDNSLTLVAALMTGAFGADLQAEFALFGLEADASIGAFPLTITVITLAVSVWVFRRVTASYERALDALADAARASLIVGLALMVIALVFRADTREFGRGWGADLAGTFDARIAFGAHAAGAFALGFLLLLTVLAGACLVRGGWWPARVEQVRDWVAAPLYGVGVLGLLLPVAGLVGFGLLMISGDAVEEATDPSGDELRIAVALVFTMLASGGMWLLGLGAGGAYGARGGGDEGRTEDLHHLAHYTDESPGLWAAPLVMLLVIGTVTYLVARRATVGRLLPALAGWLMTLLVVIPLLVRMSGLHGSISGRGAGERFEQWGWIGLVGWQSTVLLTLVALLVAWLVAWRAGALNGVGGRARQLGQKVQANPGRPAQPSSQPGSPVDPGSSHP